MGPAGKSGMRNGCGGAYIGKRRLMIHDRGSLLILFLLDVWSLHYRKHAGPWRRAAPKAQDGLKG